MKTSPKIVVVGLRGIPDALGGIETHCQELLPLLAQKGNDITVIRRADYFSDNLTQYKGVKLYDIKSPKSKSFETIIHTFKAINAAKFHLKADIVHIHAIGPALLVPYARILGLKVIFTHHGRDYDRDKWGKIAKTILKVGEYCGAKFSNRIIVISELLQKSLKNKFKARNISLIYNGVPKPQIITDGEYLGSLGIEKDKYIFAMGRFVPEKNFDKLINAFSKIKSDYKLVIAGDNLIEDDYSLRLKKIGKEKGVIMPGFIKGEKLYSLLTNAGLFILPSSHEGLPIALLEAMSYDLNALVSDIKPNLEVGLSEDSYFQTNNTQDFIMKLNQKLANPGKVKYDMEKYDWDIISQKTAEVYDSL